MSEQTLQDAILESVDVVVDAALKKMKKPENDIGIVIEDPIGFEIKVKVRDNIVTCTLPEDKHSWIQKDDIVVIQDLFGNGQKNIVQGKIGQLQKTPSLVFYDEDKDRLISGSDGIFDEDGDKITYGTVIEE